MLNESVLVTLAKGIDNSLVEVPCCWSSCGQYGTYIICHFNK